MQSVAARQLLPEVNVLLDRDKLSDFSSIEPVRCLLNGWFLHGSKWPPSSSIDPLLTSFHVSSSSGAKAVISKEESVKWLKRHGPVGCRSENTVKFLEKLGISCYFSGCLTLTLERPLVERCNKIVWVDVSPPWWWTWGNIPEGTDSVFEYVTHRCVPWLDSSFKYERCRHLLELYAGAKLVVTSRLHVALPCVAFGTPVVFVMPDYEPDRVAPYLHLMSYCVTSKDFKDGKAAIDWNSPKPPGCVAELRDGLLHTVRQWTGTGAMASSAPR
jgi:hypothetical protein